VVGEAAVDFIRQFKVDFAVIGASAIDADGALLDYDYREVRGLPGDHLERAPSHPRCDATKFERSAPVRIGHISQVNTFITDHCPSDVVRRVCAESGVELVETAPAIETVFPAQAFG
jgi:DeoR family glycerol-3-phosphate regulon repressor